MNAFKSKDLKQLLTVSHGSNKEMISDILKEGENHPRYKYVEGLTNLIKLYKAEKILNSSYKFKVGKDIEDVSVVTNKE